MLQMKSYSGSLAGLIRGFGLLECMTVLMITAILVSLLRPSFRDLIDTVRVVTAANQLYAAIGHARSEAMKRGMRVDVIPMRAKDFSHGWVVIVDSNTNHVADAGEIIVQRSSGLPHNLEIKTQLRDNAFPYLAFDPSGRPRSNASSDLPQIGSLLLTVGQKKRKLIMAFLGRVRICDPDKSSSTC